MKDDKVKVYCLSGGVQVIATESIGHKGSVFWDNPLVIQFRPTQDGKVSLSFIPLILFSNEDRYGPINENSVVFSLNPDDKMREAYLQQVLQFKAMKAGLVVAPAGAEKNIEKSGLVIGS